MTYYLRMHQPHIQNTILNAYYEGLLTLLEKAVVFVLIVFLLPFTLSLLQITLTYMYVGTVNVRPWLVPKVYYLPILIHNSIKISNISIFVFTYSKKFKKSHVHFERAKIDKIICKNRIYEKERVNSQNVKIRK